MRKNDIVLLIVFVCVYIVLALIIGAVIGNIDGAVTYRHLNDGNGIMSDGENIVSDNADWGLALIPELAWIPWVAAALGSFLIFLIYENDTARRTMNRIYEVMDEMDICDGRQQLIFKEAQLIVADKTDGAGAAITDIRSMKKVLTPELRTDSAVMRLLHNAEAIAGEKEALRKRLSSYAEEYNAAIRRFPFVIFKNLAGMKEFSL